MLLYHWEHCGIIKPFIEIKRADTQVFINASKTQTWVALTRLPRHQALEIALQEDKQFVGPRREIYAPHPYIL